MAKNTCVNSVGQTKLKPTTLLAEQITPGGSAEQSLHTSLLCGPISPVVNLEMSSTARFFCGNAIYGCSGLGNCRMLKFLSIAFFVIDLISMLIR